MKELGNYTVNELLAQIESSRADIGGGTAALLAAAMGASLHAMACSVTIKRGLEADSSFLDKRRIQASSVAASLLELAQEDGQSFGKVLEAMRLPRSTEEESALRDKSVQLALQHAVDVPLQAAELCLEEMQAIQELRQHCVRTTHSDIMGGNYLLACGVRGSLLNVWQNCSSLNDAQSRLDKAHKIKDECEKLIAFQNR